MTGNQPAYAAARDIAQSGYGRLVAFLAKRTRDVAAAEDALAEAFAAALRDWPKQGVPEKPEAWLLAVARRKTVDRARRQAVQAAGVPHLQMLQEELDAMIAQSRHIPDERLGLMFACAHPAMDEAARAPLILQTILGLTAGEISAAFLVSPAAMGQRLARAKAKIKLAGVPFRVPEAPELPERLDAVLDAVYAAFSAGWIDPDRSGGLAEEALWLGRLICGLLPDEPEALGLSALMLAVHSRREARRSRAGAYVPLSEQDTDLWDSKMIDEAAALLLRAGAMGQIGRFQLEAAIQAVHAARQASGFTDWAAIALLYDGLFARLDSPVVAINRAVAHGKAFGAEAGLLLLPELAAYPELQPFQPYWAARAALLAEAGQAEAAEAAYARAIERTEDDGQRMFLLAKAAELGPGSGKIAILRPGSAAKGRSGTR